MTGDEARAELEAAIWRSQRLTGSQVDAILAAADFYAEQYADEVLAHIEAENAGRKRLAKAATEVKERKR